MRGRTIGFPDSLYERAKAAMWHTRTQPGAAQTLNAFIRLAVETAVRRLEAEHNDGQPFPRVDRLPTGPGIEGAARGAQLRARQRARGGAQEEDRGDDA